MLPFMKLPIMVESSNLIDVLNAMDAIKNCGDPTAATLLQQAGRNIAPHFKQMTIRLSEGPMLIPSLKRELATDGGITSRRDQRWSHPRRGGRGRGNSIGQ
jgi:hypothetical protein